MTYVALITGASSGIGEATARRLAASPTSSWSSSPAARIACMALAAEHRPRGHDVIAADLTDPATPKLIAETVEREHGALHLLVNNAGARWSTGLRRRRLGQRRAATCGSTSRRRSG